MFLPAGRRSCFVAYGARGRGRSVRAGPCCGLCSGFACGFACRSVRRGGCGGRRPESETCKIRSDMRKTNVMQIVRLVMMIAAVAGVIYALEYMERGIAVWFWITLLGVGFVGLPRSGRRRRNRADRSAESYPPDIAPGGFFWRGLRRRAGNFGKFSGRSMRLSWPGIFGSCRVPIRRAMRTPSLRSPPPPEDFAVVIGGKAVGGIGLAPGTDVGRFNAGIGCRIGASYRGLVPGTGWRGPRSGFSQIPR